MNARTALIIGCGLAGSLLARLLAVRGWRVTAVERRGDPRLAEYQGGRSINLALSARGRWGLAAADLEARVIEQDAIAMRGRMMHSRAEELTFQPYSVNGEDAIYSVSRSGLNTSLLKAAGERVPGGGSVEFVFNSTCVDIDLVGAKARFIESGSAGLVERTGDLVIGADGAFSPVRLAMQRTDRFEFSQTYLGHGYKELRIGPAAAQAVRAAQGASSGAMNGQHGMEKHALHIWPRGSSMMIALPNLDGSFTCTLFWPFEGASHSFASLRSAQEIAEHFEREYPDAARLMPDLVSQYQSNPVGSLVTIKCGPWNYGRGCVVLGDAAHAIVPFYGQGMNAAFEDCRVLVECLDATGNQSDALEAFWKQRKPSADAIAQMAVDNFVEMRDLVGNQDFLYQKKIEQALHGLFPTTLVPQYNLVSFTTVPYEEALARGGELLALYRGVMDRVPSTVLKEQGQDNWMQLVRLAAEAVLAGAGEKGEAARWKVVSEQAGEKTNTRAKDHTGERASSDASGGEAGASETLRVAHDLSPVLRSTTGVWRGDTPLSRRVLCDLSTGASVTLSTLESTVHLGSHADGQNHYDLGGPCIAAMPIEHYVGNCQVIYANVAKGGRVAAEHLNISLNDVTSARVLIRTGTFPDAQNWNDDFAALCPSLVHALAARGVITIGIDTPSVDTMESKDLQAHLAFAEHRMAILEGLVLAEVPQGYYFLVATPLRLEGFDASPVRALLLKS